MIATDDGPTGSDERLAAAAAAVRDDWAATGLDGSFWVRDLDTGRELGFAPDRGWALASLIKLPIALVVLDRVATGVLDAARSVRLAPDTRTPGPTGLGAFSHPAQVAVEDLVLLMLSISDNAAADALLDLVPPAEVAAAAVDWGVPALVCRHRMRDLYDAVDRVAHDLPHGLHLAVQGSTRGGGHVVEMLDPAHANAGTARSLVDLLEAIWDDRISTPPATARLRELMARQVTRHRLAAEIASDRVTVRSKTGTFLHLRHEAGVVETAAGDRLAMAALTASRVPTTVQPEAELAIARAARRALEQLRR